MEHETMSDLALVNAIAREVNALTDQAAIFRQVIDSVTRHLHLHPAIIFMVDGQTGEATNVDSSLPDLAAGEMSVSAGMGLVGTALAERRTVLSQDVSRDTRYRPTIGNRAYDEETAATHSEIVIPLIFGDELCGLLNVHKAAVGGFTERDQMVLEALGYEVATAIYRTRQTERLQEQAWVSTAQFWFAKTVSEHRHLDSLLTAITRLIPMLVGGSQIGILLWDQANHHYVPRTLYGANSEKVRLFFSQEYTLDDWGTLAAVHLSGESVPTGQIPPWMQTGEMDRTGQSCFVAPLLVEAHRVGALFIINEPETINFYPDQHSRRWYLLQNIVLQTAQAIDREQIRQSKWAERAERRELEKEIALARGIQASLIPLNAPTIPGLNIASHWQAAKRVSGDFYDFLPLPDGKYGIIIADVAGKGMPAALFMALSRTILRAVAVSRQDPAETLGRANEILLNDTRSDMFVTVFYAVWDAGTQTLTWANGGHNHPLLVRNGAITPLLRPKHGNDLALGVIPDATYHEGTTQLQPNDTILFYTDGVTEAESKEKALFSLRRLHDVMRDTAGQSPQQVIDDVTAALDTFVDGAETADDVTMVALSIQ